MNLKQRNDLQKYEARGAYNMYMAHEYYNHEPTPDEAMMYYATHGGSESLEKRHPETRYI